MGREGNRETFFVFLCVLCVSLSLCVAVCGRACVFVCMK